MNLSVQKLELVQSKKVHIFTSERKWFYPKGLSRKDGGVLRREYPELSALLCCCRWRLLQEPTEGGEGLHLKDLKVSLVVKLIFTVSWSCCSGEGGIVSH